MDWYDTHQYAAGTGPSSSGGPPPRWGADRDFDKHFREQFGTAAVADSEEEAELRRAAWATWKTPGPTYRPQTRPSAVADEDEELSLAIAMSMAEGGGDTGAASGSGSGSGSRARTGPNEIIQVLDSDEEEELQRHRAEEYSRKYDTAHPAYVGPGGTPAGAQDTHFRRQGPAKREREEAELPQAMKASKEQSTAPKRQKRDETPEEERKLLEEAIKASMADASGSDERPPLDRDPDSEDSLRAANEAFQAERAADRERQRQERERKKLENGNSTNTSAAGSPAPAPAPAPASAPAESSTPAQAKPALPSGGMPLLNRAYVDKNQLFDRAQMERERLARQAAREAQNAAAGSSSSTTAGPSTSSASAAPSGTGNASTSTAPKNELSRVETLQQRQPSQAGPSGSTQRPRAVPPSLHPLHSPGPFPLDAAGEFYPDGEMRHSRLDIGEPTTAPTFTVDQMMGEKSQISLLILSSFVLDDEWLMDKLPKPEQTPTIIIRPHPKDKNPAWNGKVQAQPTGEVFCFPLMASDYGSAHMKFAWIFYKTGRLRVVVMSANMVPYDWDWIENSIFIQDFLPCTTPAPLNPDLPAHDFPLQFTRLFIHLKIHKALRFLTANHPLAAAIPFSYIDDFADAAKWDWRRVKVRLVMSVPGTYEGARLDLYGICRFGKILREGGWLPGKGEKLVAEFQGSSLGTYAFTWYDTFYQYLSGKTTDRIRHAPKSKAWPPLKVLFPSLDTVDKSVLGRNGGGTMFAGKAFTSVSRPLFHDANSKRGGVLMHAKVLIGLFEPKDRALGFDASPNSKQAKRKAAEMESGSSEGDGVGGWVYMGSHNFSSAAWGTLNMKKAQLNIRNYEMGIVFPLPRKTARAAADEVAPYKRPARPYSAEDVPWNQYEHGEQAQRAE